MIKKWGITIITIISIVIDIILFMIIENIIGIHLLYMVFGSLLTILSCQVYPIFYNTMKGVFKMALPPLVTPEQLKSFKEQIETHKSLIKQLNVARNAGSPVDEQIKQTETSLAALEKQLAAWEKYYIDEGLTLPY